MFRKLADFHANWQYESESTLKVMRAMTDASLATTVGSDNRTLARIAWHITGTLPEMMGLVGLTVKGPAPDAPPPASAAAIAAAYETAAQSLAEELRANWQDETLATEDPMYGYTWKKGFTLQALINHQAHHRGQMTMLMRQAGLAVPGVYGPAREEWAAIGAPPPEV